MHFKIYLNNTYHLCVHTSKLWTTKFWNQQKKNFVTVLVNGLQLNDLNQEKVFPEALVNTLRKKSNEKYYINQVTVNNFNTDLQVSRNEFHGNIKQIASSAGTKIFSLHCAAPHSEDLFD